MISFRRQAKGLEHECLGMTALETLLAIGMLMVFTGVVVMVLQFTLSFFKEAESGEKNEFDTFNGVLIDHQQLHIAMDSLVEVLSQPGISRDRLHGLIAQDRCPLDGLKSNCVPCTDDVSEKCSPGIQISFDPDLIQPNEACVSSPAADWGLSELITEVSLPPGYRLCLWSTSLKESNPYTNGISEPGIYLLQALPEQISPSSLPTRRLFCRPRPFC